MYEDACRLGQYLSGHKCTNVVRVVELPMCRFKKHIGQWAVMAFTAQTAKQPRLPLRNPAAQRCKKKTFLSNKYL